MLPFHQLTWAWHPSDTLIVRVECYGASRAAGHGGPNEDAYWIARGGAVAVALCDGAGHAQQCGARTVQLFAQRVDTGALELASFPSWRQWLVRTDAGLVGGEQTTFLGVALVEDRLLGGYVGDSRAFLVNEHGCRLVTTERTPRLGSGETNPLPIHERLAPRDVVLLMSDGAWGPLSACAIHATVMSRTMDHLADLPGALLDIAGARGRADDMTIVALRALR